MEEQIKDILEKGIEDNLRLKESFKAFIR